MSLGVRNMMTNTCMEANSECVEWIGLAPLWVVLIPSIPWKTNFRTQVSILTCMYMYCTHTMYMYVPLHCHTVHVHITVLVCNTNIFVYMYILDTLFATRPNKSLWSWSASKTFWGAKRKIMWYIEYFKIYKLAWPTNFWIRAKTLPTVQYDHAG